MHFKDAKTEHLYGTTNLTTSSSAASPINGSVQPSNWHNWSWKNDPLKVAFSGRTHHSPVMIKINQVTPGEIRRLDPAQLIRLLHLLLHAEARKRGIARPGKRDNI